MQPIAIFSKKFLFYAPDLVPKASKIVKNGGFHHVLWQKAQSRLKPNQLYYNVMGCNQSEDTVSNLLFISIRRNGFDGAIGPVLNFSNFYIS